MAKFSDRKMMRVTILYLLTMLNSHSLYAHRTMLDVAAIMYLSIATKNVATVSVLLLNATFPLSLALTTFLSRNSVQHRYHMQQSKLSAQ